MSYVQLDFKDPCETWTTCWIMTSSCRTHLPELSDAPDRAPIKLHAAADAVNSRANHHDVLVVELQVVLGAVVGQVQVVCVGGPFGCHCINLLYYGQDGPIMTQLSHYQFCAVRGKKKKKKKLQIFNFGLLFWSHTTSHDSKQVI